jgi:type II secretory pathway component PulJ
MQLVTNWIFLYYANVFVQQTGLRVAIENNQHTTVKVTNLTTAAEICSAITRHLISKGMFANAQELQNHSLFVCETDQQRTLHIQSSQFCEFMG